MPSTGVGVELGVDVRVSVATPLIVGAARVGPVTASLGVGVAVGVTEGSSVVVGVAVGVSLGPSLIVGVAVF